MLIVPLLSVEDEQHIILIRQHRVAPGLPMLELPAGTLERGENPFGCAARELEEETGYRAATVTSLGRFYTSPGLSDELMHAFVGADLIHVGQSLEDDEEIEVVQLPVRSLGSLIASGDLLDGKSLTGLALAVHRGVLPPSVLETENPH